ncbi:hypothetical protein K7432_005775 [Basidiobolus ranarum]|uniref:G protein gamma domain-containing protein n=1 Tax=Basidiobolus ranarum TaxID=34480 RepID=A0ABR2W2M7_9FUNG
MTHYQQYSSPTKLQVKSSGMILRSEKLGKNRVGVIRVAPKEALVEEVEDCSILAEDLSRERIPVSQASCSLINYSVSKRDLFIPNSTIDRAIKRTSRYNIEPTQNPPPCLCQIM